MNNIIVSQSPVRCVKMVTAIVAPMDKVLPVIASRSCLHGFPVVSRVYYYIHVCIDVVYYCLYTIIGINLEYTVINLEYTVINDINRDMDISHPHLHGFARH